MLLLACLKLSTCETAAVKTYINLPHNKSIIKKGYKNAKGNIVKLILEI